MLPLHGLGAELGIDAGGAEEEQLFHPGFVGAVDDVGFDHQVVVDEFSTIGVIGIDAADFCSSKNDIVRAFLGKEFFYVGLATEVELCAGFVCKVFVAVGEESADDSATNETSVSSDVDFGVEVHDKCKK